MHFPFPLSTPAIPNRDKVAAVSAALAGVHDPNEIADIVVEVLQQRFGAGRAFVILDRAVTKAGML